MAVDLEFGTYGKPENPPLLVLHGLLGSTRNWLGVGRALAEHYNVILIDLRNHGNSPHADEMNYDVMVEDLEAWVETKDLDSFYILGHSMGGKVAMAYACRNPERVKGLIVEDIAVREYGMRYELEFEAMNKLDLSLIKSRKDADEAMAEWIEEWAWRQFILTNLVRDKEAGGFCWQINLPVLTRDLANIMKRSLREDEVFEGPVLFMKGGESDFITDGDKADFKKHFPRHAVVKIEGAGHNVHVDNGEGMVKALIGFVDYLEKPPSMA